MPRLTIENAIKKGTGELEGRELRGRHLRGYGPGGVAIFIGAATNNRSRTAPTCAPIFERGGGNLGHHRRGRVSVQQKTGILSVKTDTIEEDALLELAARRRRRCATRARSTRSSLTPVAFHKVKEALTAAKVTIEASVVTSLRPAPSRWKGRTPSTSSSSSTRWKTTTTSKASATTPTSPNRSAFRDCANGSLYRFVPVRTWVLSHPCHLLRNEGVGRPTS